MAKSIIQKEKECFVCRMYLGVETKQNLHRHHVFEGTSNRKQSEKYGMTVWLCAPHHNMSNDGIHFNKVLDLKVKEYAQSIFEANLGNRDDFRRIFGRSYL